MLAAASRFWATYSPRAARLKKIEDDLAADASLQRSGFYSTHEAA